MPVIKMRDYQTEALDALARGRAEGQKKQLVVLPTGSGKTIVAAEDIRRVVQQTGQGALFIAHRDELIKQPAEKIPLVWDDPDIGRVKAKDNELGHQVTVASVQTIHRDRRLQQIVEAQKYSILYIDEAHHAAAKSYIKIVEALVEANPELLVVGLTATPVRADGTRMKEVFSDITYEKSILDLIKDGYLADLELQQVPLDISIDGIKKSAGDLKPSEVRQVVTKQQIMISMVDAWKNTAIQRRTIAFAVDVEHANQLAQCFRARGVKSEVIFGDMPNDLRVKRLEDFQKGKIQVLTSVMVLTEGYDDKTLADDAPPLSCIMLARPTLSQSLYIQQIGRGTRTAPLKKNCLILDFSYNSKRHHIVQLPHLFGLEQKDVIKKGKKEFEALEEKKIPSILAAVREAERVDISQPPPRAGFRWAESKIGFVLSIGQDHGHIIIRPTDDDEKLFNVFHLEPPEESVKEGRRARSEEYKEHRLTSKPLTHEWAFGLAEDACRELYETRSQGRTMVKKLIEKEAEWLMLPPTDKQMKLLSRMGKKAETRAEASNIISAMIIEKTYRDREPATKKQKGFLRWKKIPFNEPLTKGEAGRLITEHNRAEKEKQSKRQREMF
jgi:superfamily II DNA or RNA helicase